MRSSGAKSRTEHEEEETHARGDRPHLAPGSRGNDCLGGLSGSERQRVDLPPIAANVWAHGDGRLQVLLRAGEREPRAQEARADEMLKNRVLKETLLKK